MTDEVMGPPLAVPDDYPIPLQLRNDNFRFIKVDKGDRPDCDPKQCFKKAIERDWPDTKNYAWDHPELVGWIVFAGGNYGVMPRGTISIVDLDDMAPADALTVVEDLGETFTVVTGSGRGLHVYIDCDAVDDKFPFEAKDHTFHGDFYNPGCRAFVVGPGCRHWSGGTYTVLRDAPIARVPAATLKAFIARTNYVAAPPPLLIPTASNHEIRASLTDQLGLRIADFAMPVNPKWTGEQWQGAHPLHGSSKGPDGMNFAVHPGKNVWRCYRDDVGGDPVSWIALLANPGMECADLKTEGVTGERFQSVIDYLWYRGYAERLSELGHRPSGKPEAPPPPAPLGPDGQPVAQDGTPIWAPPANQSASLPQKPVPPLVDISDLLILPHPTLEIRNIEPDHFIRRYMDWAGEKTDAYHEIHFGCAITLLSIAAQRCAMIHLKQEHVTSCIWTFMVGRSSTSRKSTSVKFMQRIIDDQREIAPDQLATDFSPEAFIESMAEHPRSFFIKDEAAGLLAKMKKPYMGGMRDNFCLVYDGNSFTRKLTRKQKGQNEFYVRNPYMTMLLATTPDSFEKEADPDNLGSGWFYRYLWIWPNRDKDKNMPLDMEVPALREEEAELRMWLHRLIVFFGTRRNDTGADNPVLFGISKEQFARFNDWTMMHEKRLVSESTDFKASFFARLQIYVLKLAMIFTIGQPNADRMMDRAIDPIPIPDRYFDEAMRMVDDHFMPIAFKVYEKVDLAGADNDQKKIIKAMTQYGGKMFRRDLMKRVRMKKRDFDEAISQLIDETGEIVETMERTKSGHAMIKYYLRRDDP